MIACIVIPGFELRAALRVRPALALGPAALAPVEGEEPVIGPVTAAAEAAGVRPGMRLGEALATCPSLALVEPDPAGAEQAWEEIVRRVEDVGIAVEPVGQGCAYFETRGVERLYGGVEGALRRALSAVGASWDPRAGAAERRFAALAAANVARPGQALVVDDGRTAGFLAPLPLELLPLEERRREELAELGIRRVGDLAALPAAAVGERLGTDGRKAWEVARGAQGRRVRARRPAAELDAVLARPERADRLVRKLALSARLVGGGSWRRTLTLREPNAERDRLRVALGPKLTELPAPVVALKLEAVEVASSTGRQLELVKPEGDELASRLGEGLRQVRASTGGGAVCTVVEVAPWSRIPEQRALLVARDE